MSSHSIQQACVVGYVRVSTDKQGQSGLGLEAQRAAVEQYAAQSGLRVVGWYTEIESGKLADRPELAKALAHARRNKATLVVAKLDRLSRNVAFVSALMDSKVHFLACDQPFANRLTMHILAAVAEAEAKAISDRTKAALAAYRARGGKLGAELPQCRNLTVEGMARGRVRSAQARSRNAREAVADLLPVILELRGAGKSLREIAVELTAQGHVTRRGNGWSAMQVLRAMKSR